MRITLVDLLLDRKKREEKYFQDYLLWAKKIKKEAETLLGELKIFVFGSIIKKRVVTGSDIDILIISPHLKTSVVKTQIRTKLWKKLGFSSPFEIHLVTPQEFQWYERFIDKKIEI